MKRILGFLGALALMLGGLLLGSGTAQAVWSCHYWHNGSAAYSMCDFGTGGDRAWALCDDGYTQQTLFGPWVTAGYTSSVVCRGTLKDYGYQWWGS